MPTKRLTAPLRSISYTANPYGYTVAVIENSNILDEYHAGNSPHDSTEQLPITSSMCIPYHLLKQFAKRTALEFAKEFKVSPAHVSFDSDLLEEII